MSGRNIPTYTPPLCYHPTMITLLGLEIRPGARLVLLVHQGGTIFGTFEKEVDDFLILGPSFDDNHTRASVHRGNVVAVKILPRRDV